MKSNHRMTNLNDTKIKIFYIFLSMFLLVFLLIKFDKRFILTNYLIFFRHLKNKNILKQ